MALTGFSEQVFRNIKKRIFLFLAWIPKWRKTTKTKTGKIPMANIDLDRMNLDELKTLQKDVMKMVSELEDRAKHEALAAVREKAHEMGFSLEELTGSAAKSKTGKIKGAVKYVHPDDASKTWTGRGRRPDWIKKALAGGRSLEEFLVGKN